MGFGNEWDGAMPWSWTFTRTYTENFLFLEMTGLESEHETDFGNVCKRGKVEVDVEQQILP